MEYSARGAGAKKKKRNKIKLNEDEKHFYG